jgi:hypothetical protein
VIPRSAWRLAGEAQVVRVDEQSRAEQVRARAHEHLVLFSTHDRDLIALTGARVLELPARGT